MFTGIITDIGRIRRLTRSAGADLRLEVEAGFAPASIAIGASIAHSGVCLTVVEMGALGAGAWYAVEASAETLACTTMATWREGGRVNLERAARLGDEMGGHVVSGHVDGIGELLAASPDNGSHRLVFRAPAPLHRLIARKGSIAVDGVSLTVNGVSDDRFEVNIIAHTWTATTLGALRLGDKVNLEIDMLARYVARFLETAP
jgi:riboflavin synthase